MKKIIDKIKAELPLLGAGTRMLLGEILEKYLTSYRNEIIKEIEEALPREMENNLHEEGWNMYRNEMLELLNKIK
jgi:hypothetical protein